MSINQTSKYTLLGSKQNDYCWFVIKYALIHEKWLSTRTSIQQIVIWYINLLRGIHIKITPIDWDACEQL